MAFNASLAVLMAAKYCRQCPLFEWREEALPDMGRRADKFWCRVDLTNLLQDRRGEMLMALFPAQLSFLDFQKESALYKLKALLVTLKHPYILPVVDIYYSKDKKAVLVVQPFVSSGSLKDRIHRACPTRAYQEKYRLCGASPLAFHEVARFGRQILEALRALRSKGIVCEHLSSGNVVIDQGNARIADIYAPLLAIDRDRESRECTVALESRVDVDVLLFGHVLYEMASGMELLATAPDESVLECLAPDIAHALRCVFDPPPRSANASAVGQGKDDSAPTTVDDEVASTYSDGSGDSGGSSNASGVNAIDQLLACELFTNADVPPIETLFAGFRFDSSMKSTVRNSMRINASRNHAHIVQYKEKEALLRARRRAERRVYEEKEKHERRAQQLAFARSAANGSSKGMNSGDQTVLSRRKSYRAHSFKAPVARQLSGDTASTTTA